MDGQDWTPVKIASRPRSSAASLSVTGKRISSAAGAERTIADTDYVKPKHLTTESRQTLVAKRVAMGKSQTEFNQLCSFPPNTIKEFESGRLTPTIGQLNTLNRILKTGLKLTA